MKVLLSQVRPNPFRNMDRYPLDPAKIEALRESIRSTGFWGNVVARRAAGDGGDVELAYGHHRWHALHLESGPDDPEIDLIELPLSDEDMLQIMARENMHEWGTSATVEIETVRAVIQAYADGKIALNEPVRDTSKNVIRYAPGFALGGNGREAQPDRPYTASTVAPFLGWSTDKVKDTLGHLEMIEAGILDDAAYRGLSTWQALAVTGRARELRDSTAATLRETEDEAERARAEAERQRQIAEEAEAERARQAELRAQADEQLAEQARVAEQRAQASWEAAQEQRRLAEQRAEDLRAKAERGRQEAAERAAEGARAAGDQLRGGTPVREVQRQARPERQARHAAAEPDGQHPMETKAAEAAALLHRMLKDSDIAEYLKQVTANQSVISPESHQLLAGALTALIDDATAWRDKIAVPVTAG